MSSLPQSFNPWDEPGPDEEALPSIDPSVLASDQIVQALAHLDRHPDSLVRWPWPDLDRLTGPMGAGEVWFVAAGSGGGKTSFVASAIDCWRHAGKKIFVMPLELQPYRFRTYLACMETGTRPGDALSGQLRADPSRLAERERLMQAITDQVKGAYVHQVMISEQRAINVAGLKKGLMEAKAFGAHIVIVDHIDHIADDLGGNAYASSKSVNHAALRMAQDNDLLLLFTSQLNMEIGKADRLSKYAPPQDHHILFPSVKRQVATGMIGLYRPLRQIGEDESPDAFAAAIKAARAGNGDIPALLEPSTMGVVYMKSRNYGEFEGAKAFLGFERGRVVHRAERDRFTTSYEGLKRVE